MIKTRADRRSTPVDQDVDPEVLAFRQQFDQRSPLDVLVREGARKMLQAAIDAEVDAFVAQHRERQDEHGRRQVVKNGSLPSRELLTGAGPIEVSQGRVRDNSPDPENRVRFRPSILPAYLRRTDTIEDLIPWLYLKGIFEALDCLGQISFPFQDATKVVVSVCIVRFDFEGTFVA